MRRAAVRTTGARIQRGVRHATALGHCAPNNAARGMIAKTARGRTLTTDLFHINNTVPGQHCPHTNKDDNPPT